MNKINIELTLDDIKRINQIISFFKKELESQSSKALVELRNLNTKMQLYIVAVNLFEKHEIFESQLISEQESDMIYENFSKIENELISSIESLNEIKNTLLRFKGR